MLNLSNQLFKRPNMTKLLIPVFALTFSSLCNATNWKVIDIDEVKGITVAIDIDSIKKEYWEVDKIPFVSAWGRISYDAPQYFKSDDFATLYKQVDTLMAFKCPTKKSMMLANAIYVENTKLVYKDKVKKVPSLDKASYIENNSPVDKVYNVACHTSLSNELKAGYWDKPNDLMKLVNEYPIQLEELGHLKKTGEKYSPDKYQILK